METFAEGLARHDPVVVHITDVFVAVLLFLPKPRTCNQWVQVLHYFRRGNLIALS